MNDPMLDLEARRLSVAFALQEDLDATADILARSREIYAFLSNTEASARLVYKSEEASK